MGTLEIFFLFVLPQVLANITKCHSNSCSENGPTVHFPFRLRKYQSPRCRYSREFDLSCNSDNQTILSLPFLGDFTVQDINYEDQTLRINDPNYCLPKRFLTHDFNALTSPLPLLVDRSDNYTFFNCSWEVVPTTYRFTPITCLSTKDFAVVAFPSEFVVLGGPNTTSPSSSPSPSPSPSCSVIKTALIPLSDLSRFGDLTHDIRLIWSKPNCKCESCDGSCALQSQIGCYSSASSRSKQGLPRSAKYGIIIGVGVPGLLFIIGLSSYIYGRITGYRQSHQPDLDLSASTVPPPTIVVMGLDGPTIESYPKTQLGESRRLPKPNDNTCPICLCEYQPKETLRTLPNCNHYFHVSCIDEWLKMNATCPFCRTSPESSSRVTPSPSNSSSFSFSSL